MSKESSIVISVRISPEVLDKIDNYVESSPIKITRSSALVYLISKGLIAEGID